MRVPLFQRGVRPDARTNPPSFHTKRDLESHELARDILPLNEMLHRGPEVVRPHRYEISRRGRGGGRSASNASVNRVPRRRKRTTMSAVVTNSRRRHSTATEASCTYTVPVPHLLSTVEAE